MTSSLYFNQIKNKHVIQLYCKDVEKGKEIGRIINYCISNDVSSATYKDYVNSTCKYEIITYKDIEDRLFELIDVDESLWFLYGSTATKKQLFLTLLNKIFPRLLIRQTLINIKNLTKQKSVGVFVVNNIHRLPDVKYFYRCKHYIDTIVIATDKGFDKDIKAYINSNTHPTDIYMLDNFDNKSFLFYQVLTICQKIITKYSKYGKSLETE